MADLFRFPAGPIAGQQMTSVPIAVLEALLRLTGGSVTLDAADVMRDNNTQIVCVQYDDPWRLSFKLEERA